MTPFLVDRKALTAHCQKVSGIRGVYATIPEKRRLPKKIDPGTDRSDWLRWQVVAGLAFFSLPNTTIPGSLKPTMLKSWRTLSIKFYSFGGTSPFVLTYNQRWTILSLSPCFLIGQLKTDASIVSTLFWENRERTRFLQLKNIHLKFFDKFCVSSNWNASQWQKTVKTSGGFFSTLFKSILQSVKSQSKELRANKNLKIIVQFHEEYLELHTLKVWALAVKDSFLPHLADCYGPPQPTEIFIADFLNSFSAITPAVQRNVSEINQFWKIEKHGVGFAASPYCPVPVTLTCCLKNCAFFTRSVFLRNPKWLLYIGFGKK